MVEKPLLTSSLVLLVVAICVLGLSSKYYIYDFDAFWPQILAEAHGMIFFDIAVIGILLFWLNQKRRNPATHQNIYKDEIDDFCILNLTAAFSSVECDATPNHQNEINLVTVT